MTQHIVDVPERVRPAIQAACNLFLSADSSNDYEKYVAAPTTGRMTPFINGRYWGGAEPQEIGSMPLTACRRPSKA